MNKKMGVSFLLAWALVIGMLWLIVESDRAAQEQNTPAPFASTPLPPHLSAQRVASGNAQVTPPQSPAVAPPQSNQIECAFLKLHIEQLDSMARQPRSGQMQDWIRKERRNARNRQAAIQC